MSVTRARAGIERAGERVDLQKSVGLREAGDRAGTLRRRERDRPLLAGDQRDQHEFLAAELRRDAHRHLGLDGARGFRRQSGARADHRRDEGVERKDRRGRKARQHRERLAVEHGEAKRLAGFQRDAVHDDAGRAQPRHHAVREIARPFRGAAAEQHQIAGLHRGAYSEFKSGFIVGERTEDDRFAARLGDRRRDDRAVAVKDLGGPQHAARRDQFVAGREHGDFRPAHHVDFGDTASREHADLARPDPRAAPQHHLAARDVGASVRHELSGRGGAAHLDRRFAGLQQIAVLDHHHRIGAARHDAAGGDGRCRTGHDFQQRRMSAHNDLGVEAKPPRRSVGRTRDVGGAHREAVDIGAIERRHVDRRARRHAPARGRARRQARPSRQRAAQDRYAA